MSISFSSFMAERQRKILSGPPPDLQRRAHWLATNYPEVIEHQSRLYAEANAADPFAYRRARTYFHVGIATPEDYQADKYTEDVEGRLVTSFRNQKVPC